MLVIKLRHNIEISCSPYAGQGYIYVRTVNLNKFFSSHSQDAISAEK